MPHADRIAGPRMLARLSSWILAISFVACAALPAAAADEAKPAKKYKVLVLTQSRGFMHQPVKRPAPDQLCQVEKVMQEIGQATGLFEVEPTQDASIITPEKLKTTDVLFFYTTGALPISDEGWKAVLEWIESGKGGFIGIHSATDTGWQPKDKSLMTYGQLINGQFAGHPWGQGTPITVTAHDANHPTVKMWGAEFDFKDEIYQYRNYDPKAVRVLQSLNFEKTARKAPYLVPLSWVRQHGKGRLFYSNLGHTPATWDDPRFREMIVAGVKWVTHLEPQGDATPNPEVQALWSIHSLLATTAAEKPGSESATAVVARLKNAEPAWLMQQYDAIAALREKSPPGKPQEPKMPNKADEAKDPAKYADAVKKYEDAKKNYPAAVEKYEKDSAAFNTARDQVLAEIMKKAGSATAAK